VYLENANLIGRGTAANENICAPRSIVFSPRLAGARVSLGGESACRAQAGAVYVQKLLSRVSRRPVAYPGVTCVGEQARMFNARALGQSAQAEQYTLILYYCTNQYSVAKSPSTPPACRA